MSEDNAVDLASLDWDKGDGLLPAIIQDAVDGSVLMLGYMNREALARTLAEGKVTFYSRSRQRLWQKGETSGNVLELVRVSADCDRDTLRVQARPSGPTCHLGTRTCFAGDTESRRSPGFLGELEDVIRARLEDAPEGSYVASLAARGRQRIAQKIGEEGVETALALSAGDTVALLDESADLLFHMMIALLSEGLSLNEVIERLESRHRD
ncbi:MAG: bifunctional phosphoribosyl-AMP cyclohydrolase/phosphoribosyl-ATP diphosphatase HisIE [Gammaproteobacteria bacterium]